MNSTTMQLTRDWDYQPKSVAMMEGRDILPCNFDSSLFDSEQQEYIAEYLIQYRKEVAQRILDFVISPVRS